MESNIQTKIQLAIGKHVKRMRIFRNNTGMAWVGQSVRQGNTVIIQNPRPLHAGLFKGSSDLIGWHSVTITPDMVGTKVAVFTAIEVKATAKAKRSDEQIRFIEAVQAAGGLAFFSHDPDDVVNYIRTKYPE